MTSFILAALLTATLSGQDASPIRVYLGEPPRADGFTAPTPAKPIQDSYADMRKAWKGKLAEGVELVERADQAEVILTVVSREERATGNTSTTATQYRGTVVANSNQGTSYHLTAKLTVPGTDVAMELDGSPGIWRQQAGRIVRQAAEWIDANRGVLLARRH